MAVGGTTTSSEVAVAAAAAAAVVILGMIVLSRRLLAVGGARGEANAMAVFTEASLNTQVMMAAMNLMVSQRSDGVTIH